MGQVVDELDLVRLIHQVLACILFSPGSKPEVRGRAD